MALRAVPWEDIRDAQLAKAEEQLRLRPIRPSVEHGGWLVESSNGDGTAYVVKPKWERRERVGNPARSNGHWWHVLTCDCRAAGGGYMLCWHKAAVYLYWRHCREVGRPMGVGEWMLRDGPQGELDATPPSPAPTPEEAPASDQPTRRTPRGGTARRASTPGASEDRKKRQSSH